MEIRRKVKNVVYKYSEAEKYVREATSNDPWGPSSTLMSEIADMTHSYAAFDDIMQLLWKRLNDKGKNWRHVYKSLVLLDYLAKCGNDRVAEECLQNIHTIETLKDFQYFEDHKDLGMGIREKSKALVILLKDKETLNTERSKGLKVKEKFQSKQSSIGSHQLRRPGELGREIRKQFSRDSAFPKTVMKLNFDETKSEIEDEELQRAIELSKEEHERAMKTRLDEERREEIKIKLALEQSRKEEEVLAVLRPPPKVSSDKQNNETLLTKSSKRDSLYKLGEASRIFEQHNGDLSSLDVNNKSDPWGSVATTTETQSSQDSSIPLDFDPWKSPNSFGNTKTVMNSSTPDVWFKTDSKQSRNIIDDIFGDEKPNTQFVSNWNFENNNFQVGIENNKSPDSNPWEDSDNISFSQLTKNTTGSLASLTDIGKEISGDTKHHYCSVTDLLDNNMKNSKKKTPQEFLGENANLVNLENLVPVPKAGVYRNPLFHAAKNPFGMSSSTMVSNPFNSQTGNPKVPMNQIPMGNQNNSLFSSSGNLTSMSNNNSQFNNFSSPMQPNFPLSHSQYQGFSTMNTLSNTPWPQPVAPIPNQWAINTNTANPFFN